MPTRFSLRLRRAAAVVAAVTSLCGMSVVHAATPSLESILPPSAATTVSQWQSTAVPTPLASSTVASSSATVSQTSSETVTQESSSTGEGTPSAWVGSATNVENAPQSAWSPSMWQEVIPTLPAGFENCNGLSNRWSSFPLPSGVQDTLNGFCGGSGSSSSSSSNSSSTSSSSSSTSSGGSSSSSSSAGQNLIPNPSLETDGGNGLPASWHQGGFGTNTVQFTYPVDGQGSAKAAALSITQYTDGDAKWYFDDVTVTPGVLYQFSDMFKSTAPSAVNVRYTLTDNTFAYAQIGTPPASSDWQQFSTSLTPPANAKSLTIFHLLASAGSLTVDTFSLTQGESSSSSSSSSSSTSSSSSSSATGAFDTGYVTLNFDDGWSSHYRNVLPMLNAAGLKGTFFAITNEARDADENQLNDPNAYLTYAKLKEIQAAGHEVTAHTRTHRSLVGLSLQQRTEEIQGSRDDLIGQGFSPVTSFAYPYGDYNTSVIQSVQNAGFLGARGVEDGYTLKSDNKYALKVQNVLRGTTPAQMKAWIDQAMQNKTWLTIVIHQVDNLPTTGPEDYSTTAAKLQEVVNYLKDNNIPVITTQQGLQMMP